MTDGDQPIPLARPQRTWPWYVSIVGAFALLVGLVWAAGGFQYRNDLMTEAAVGQPVETGPYVFTFSGATVQKTTNYKDEQIWSVVVIGTGRTTAEESMRPADDGFVVKDPASGAYQEKSQRQAFGPERADASLGGSLFTPGLPAIPYRVTYEFPVTAFQPASSILLAVWKLEWRDTSLLQYGEFRWDTTAEYFRLELPLRRLPDDLD